MKTRSIYFSISSLLAGCFALAGLAAAQDYDVAQNWLGITDTSQGSGTLLQDASGFTSHPNVSVEAVELHLFVVRERWHLVTLPEYVAPDSHAK